MFAVITPALISGAFAERKRFGAFVLFTGLWSIVVYSPMAHWVWSSDGWLLKAGALDFAGGTVVHVSPASRPWSWPSSSAGGSSASEKMSSPTIVPMTVLGAGLLWFGWFGFNAGSALTAGGLAASAFIVDQHGGRRGDPDLGRARCLHKGKVSVVGAACPAPSPDSSRSPRPPAT